MVDDRQISEILPGIRRPEAAEVLLETALSNGGRDIYFADLIDLTRPGRITDHDRYELEKFYITVIRSCVLSASIVWRGLRSTGCCWTESP